MVKDNTTTITIMDMLISQIRREITIITTTTTIMTTMLPQITMEHTIKHMNTITTLIIKRTILRKKQQTLAEEEMQEKREDLLGKSNLKKMGMSRMIMRSLKRIRIRMKVLKIGMIR